MCCWSAHKDERRNGASFYFKIKRSLSLASLYMGSCAKRGRHNLIFNLSLSIPTLASTFSTFSLSVDSRSLLPLKATPSRAKQSETQSCAPVSQVELFGMADMPSSFDSAFFSFHQRASKRHIAGMARHCVWRPASRARRRAALFPARPALVRKSGPARLDSDAPNSAGDFEVMRTSVLQVLRSRRRVPTCVKLLPRYLIQLACCATCLAWPGFFTRAFRLSSANKTSLLHN